MRALFVAACVLLAACTPTEVQPTTTKPTAAEKYTTVVVGEIGSVKPEHRSYALFFRTALIQQLQLEQPLVILSDPAAPVPAGAFKVTGQITEVDFGNTAARALIGFGAGSQQISGTFSLSGLNGEALTGFSSSESYATLGGMRGAYFVSIEELSRRFGTSTGQAVARWARGEPIKQPSSAPQPDARR